MKLDGYIIIAGKKKFYRWAMHVVGYRKKKPTLAKNQVALKVELTVPDDLFEEFEPKVEIDVPAHLIAKPEIKAEATTPDD